MKKLAKPLHTSPCVRMTLHMVSGKANKSDRVMKP